MAKSNKNPEPRRKKLIDVEADKISKRDRPKPNIQVSSLKVSKVSPWSAALNTFLGSIVLAVALVSVVLFSWYVFDRLGIFDKIIMTVAPPEAGDAGSKLAEYLSLKTFVKASLGITGSLIIALPMLALFSSIIYNLIARITGGFRVNLSHQELKE